MAVNLDLSVNAQIMAAPGEEVEKKAVDARIQWMRNRLASSLRCKDMVLDRLFANEDSAAAVASFIDTSDCNRLLVYDAGKGELAAVRDPRSPRGPRGLRAPRGSCERSLRVACNPTLDAKMRRALPP